MDLLTDFNISSPRELLEHDNITYYLLTGVLGLSIFWFCLYNYVFYPVEIRSPEYYNKLNKRTQAKRLREFPPPFPNGWVRVCTTNDIKDGKIKSISALGLELVAFRDGTGKVGVLDAYCPHLGAHLGSGGTIDKDGCLRCPFHGWTFDADGIVKDIPYLREGREIPKRAKTKAYKVQERLGMVFIWYHADDEEPWELKQMQTVEKDPNMYFVTSKQLFFDQHILEMANNSADYYHFQTLHAPLPVPVLDKILFATHESEVDYTQFPDEPHIAVFAEKLCDLRLLNKWSIAPKWYLDAVFVNVTFEGPYVAYYRFTTPIGKITMVKTLLVIEPFKLDVQIRYYAANNIPRVLVHFLSVIGARAFEQDREVWENRTYKYKPNLVPGDGPFPAFHRFWMQFYSENSQTCTEAIKDQQKLDW